MNRKQRRAGAEAVPARPQVATAPAQRLFETALRQYRAGQLSEAERLFRQLLVIDARHADSLNLLGAIAQQGGQLEIAVAFIGQAIGINGTIAVYHYNLGNALKGLGRLEDAVEAYSTAIRLKPNFVEAHSNLGNALRDLGRLEAAVIAYDTAIHFKADAPVAYCNLGAVQLQLGQLDAAVATSHTAIRLRPDYAEAYCNLGNALAGLGQVESAIVAFRQAAAHGYKAAEHMAAALSGVNNHSPPGDYVAELFNSYAATFERVLVGDLEYRAPQILRALVSKASPGRRFAEMADLGCGTGLVGAVFRDIADRLTGIDLSPKMARIAENKKIYDRLLIGDIAHSLNKLGEYFDLFALADVLIYVGDIEAIFAAMASFAKPRSLIVFSAEICDGDGFALRQSGRYAHSREYLEAHLARVKAVPLLWETHPIRLEKGEPCMGYHVVAAFN
jgi:predicted TPR repeat methyltransferase